VTGGGVLAAVLAVAGSLAAYAVADLVAARLGRPTLANPVLWAAVAVVVVLAVGSVPVDDYLDATRPLRWLLAPATVALAVPLAREARLVAAGGWRLLAAVAVGGAVASLVGAGVAVALGAPHALVEALAAKSVTTPIAVAIVPGGAGGAGAGGGVTDSLVAAAVVASGTVGAITVPALARRTRSGRPAPLGLGMGVVAHAIGTAELSRRSPRAVGYGVAGLVLNGVITALWLPPLLRAW
jgi:putative effector of murein hydrolase